MLLTMGCVWVDLTDETAAMLLIIQISVAFGKLGRLVGNYAADTSDQ